jgi:RNA polymerase sigma-70 factor, ECF subfamily
VSDAVEVQLKLLMLAASSGDPAAYEQLLSATADRLRNYFGRRIGRETADVEDLVQETLIAIHQRRDSYDPSLPFTAWLHAIARYKLIDHYRRTGIRSHVSADDMNDLVAVDTLAPALAGVDVERLLSILPRKQRDAIQLTRIEGFSIEEASALTGQSSSGIKVGVHRGIQRLMKKVSGQ